MIARARSTNEKKQTDIQNWQNQNEHEKWVSSKFCSPLVLEKVA